MVGRIIICCLFFALNVAGQEVNRDTVLIHENKHSLKNQLCLCPCVIGCKIIAFMRSH
jgi:hypothetical protein